MKRSEINRAIDNATAFFREMGFPLPAYAHWTPEGWAGKGEAHREVVDLGLGWDVTDFGAGHFADFGRIIFTLMNGRADAQYPKSYAHKVMHLLPGQKPPVHYHRRKMEDIHNHGGGDIMISFWPLGEDGRPGKGDVTLSLSGGVITQPAAEPLRLRPGESVFMPQNTFHQFWAEEGGGASLSIEVSGVCDDHNDNMFLEPAVRFPEVEEDEPSRHVLCQEYRQYTNDIDGEA